LALQTAELELERIAAFELERINAFELERIAAFESVNLEISASKWSIFNNRFSKNEKKYFNR
jgi:hypothetical protein